MFEDLDRDALEKISRQALNRIGDLQQELDELRDLQELAERVLSRMGPQLTLGMVTPDPAALEGADYRSITHREAALDVLRRARGPMRTSAIAQAMKAGGVVSGSNHFRNNVNTLLIRLAADGDVRKTADGWSIAEK